MSSDQRPAKVRVFSSGVPERNPAAANAPGASPARRRTDNVQLAGVDSGTAARPREGGGLLWAAGAALLFLLGCLLGGALFTMSVMFPGALM
ncbi:hypothetical protein ACLIMP_00395 [Novosphingobium aerophilum]|uniref:hypothetical protein n=1 Tax=Novosphingobium TaxID=165696 RepID=UPI0006C85C40|nr:MULTISPECIES: hypothetical protein [unclassified Novosphingobium]KPH62810.1 hypothetical protein ADT71_14470 [Novosphingobium sp. ST904]MPS71224.1 hypothetical protein [Novosphingobium sp.]TCM39220.1 hypothetical protein EDF59_106100 [Novosphingobium sp. ST904]WRT92778.1 hypothetical protein U9J33_16535 [Novosphingobium sp. RL4]